MFLDPHFKTGGLGWVKEEQSISVVVGGKEYLKNLYMNKGRFYHMMIIFDSIRFSKIL